MSFSVLDLALTFATSLLLGMRHATDPDHVVAVSAIVTRERSLGRATRIGALWGVGHTLTILAVGTAIVVLKLTFTPRLGLSMEFAVAMMLLVLGTLNLLDFRSAPASVTTLKPLLVGVVHGLAGSAAATLLILPLIDDPRMASLYLVVFGIGTIAGMALVTAAIAAPALYAATRVQRVERWIRLASGTVSVGFALYLGYRIGVVDGLFSATPRWTPR